MIGWCLIPTFLLLLSWSSLHVTTLFRFSTLHEFGLILTSLFQPTRHTPPDPVLVVPSRLSKTRTSLPVNRTAIPYLTVTASHIEMVDVSWSRVGVVSFLWAVSRITGKIKHRVRLINWLFQLDKIEEHDDYQFASSIASGVLFYWISIWVENERCI